MMETTTQTLSQPNQKLDDYNPIYRPAKLTISELADEFPETQDIITALITENKLYRDILVAKIADELKSIKAQSPDPEYQRFWRKWVAVSDGEDLLLLDRNIARLERELHALAGNDKIFGQLSEAVIEAARNTALEDLLPNPTKVRGRRGTTLCPFHEEHTPSFQIYIDENRGWCFGCNRGGNPIDVYMIMHDCGFKEAVLALTGGML